MTVNNAENVKVNGRQISGIEGREEENGTVGLPVSLVRRGRR
ncbi:hypothetical protein [Streptomyces sp. NPDC052496]